MQPCLCGHMLLFAFWKERLGHILRHNKTEEAEEDQSSSCLYTDNALWQLSWLGRLAFKISFDVCANFALVVIDPMTGMPREVSTQAGTAQISQLLKFQPVIAHEPGARQRAKSEICTG